MSEAAIEDERTLGELINRLSLWLQFIHAGGVFALRYAGTESADGGKNEYLDAQLIDFDLAFIGNGRKIKVSELCEGGQKDMIMDVVKGVKYVERDNIRWGCNYENRALEQSVGSIAINATVASKPDHAKRLPTTMIMIPEKEF